MGLCLQGGVRSVAVLGCSDGRFVVPFARAGIAVTAIDIDRVALWGGEKRFPNSERTIPGLAGRLKQEELGNRVKIVQGDYVVADVGRHEAVFTSGSIHYSHNMRHGLPSIMDAIVKTANAGAPIYIDYMLAVEQRHSQRCNYPGRGAIADLLRERGCSIAYDHYSGVFLERGHVDRPEDHYHSLGYVLARKES